MPRITRVTFQCDLCGRESKPCENGPPELWIRFSQENPMEERSFTDRCLCPQCLTDIDNARARYGS